MTFASRKARMTAPLQQRTEKIGACVADPFANGEGARELIRSPSQKGAGGGRIDRTLQLRATAPTVNSH
jgi:hypothetical protein